MRLELCLVSLLHVGLECMRGGLQCCVLPETLLSLVNERYQHLPVLGQGITAKCKYGGGGLDGLDWAGTIKGHCGAELVIIKL